MTNPRPIFGLTQVVQQPGFGTFSSLRWSAMSKKIRNEQVEQAIRHQLATIGKNVEKLMMDKVDATDRPRELAKRAGVGKGTIDRIIEGADGSEEPKTASSIATLMRVAFALGVSLAYLMVSHDIVSMLTDPTEYQGVEQVAPDLKSRRHRQAP